MGSDCSCDPTAAGCGGPICKVCNVVDNGDCDVPGAVNGPAVNGPKGRPGEPGAVPSDPPKGIAVEEGAGNMVEVAPPAAPRFRLLKFDAMPPRAPSLWAEAPPGKAIFKIWEKNKILETHVSPSPKSIPNVTKYIKYN